jgi:hypothetical protein
MITTTKHKSYTDIFAASGENSTSRIKKIGDAGHINGVPAGKRVSRDNGMCSIIPIKYLGMPLSNKKLTKEYYRLLIRTIQNVLSVGRYPY